MEGAQNKKVVSLGPSFRVCGRGLAFPDPPFFLTDTGMGNIID